jgi:hypothetical protein
MGPGRDEEVSRSLWTVEADFPLRRNPKVPKFLPQDVSYRIMPGIQIGPLAGHEVVSIDIV